VPKTQYYFVHQEQILMAATSCSNLTFCGHLFYFLPQFSFEIK